MDDGGEDGGGDDDVCDDNDGTPLVECSIVLQTQTQTLRALLIEGISFIRMYYHLHRGDWSFCLMNENKEICLKQMK